MNIYKSTLGACVLSIGLFGAANAQNLNLNKGDVYKITTAMNTTTTMKRGEKQLDFQSMSSVTKSYNITDASDAGYKLEVVTNQITDTINAFNQKLAYSSLRAAEAESEIENALAKMIGETQSLSLDKGGKITDVDDKGRAAKNDDLAAVAGLYNKPLAVGGSFNFGSNLKIPAGAKKGATWTENMSSGEATASTIYKVEEVTGVSTKVSFTTTEAQPGVNINVNGLVVIENATGVVLQRIVKVNSVGNQLKDGKNFLTSTKNIISEICAKVVN